MTNKLLLDTSFFIRLLNDEDPLHQNALAYFKYFLDQNFELKLSTVSIAEYCVRGKITDLPIENLQILPFNVQHAVKAGEFANIVFKHKNELKLERRTVIPNDTKLFAQAAVEDVNGFVTSDKEAEKIIAIIQKEVNLKFKMINIYTPYHEYYGVLDL